MAFNSVHNAFVWCKSIIPKNLVEVSIAQTTCEFYPK
uniref:Uncharacterized protein n=1 Tax=Anguilla anguilla TaxID=7936 RepID=A0A0E9TWX2_ANGAN